MNAIIEAGVMRAEASFIKAAAFVIRYVTPMAPLSGSVAPASTIRRLSRGRTSLSAVAPSFHTLRGGMTALAYAA